jgi:regulator of sirC expression with transglutaminase-like and TPR domain
MTRLVPQYQRLAALLIVLSFSALPSFAENDAAKQPKLPTREEIDASIKAVHELAKKDENELTYLAVALAASKVLQPDLDVKAIEELVSEIGTKIKESAAKAKTAADKVAAINQVIYEQYGFKVDTEQGSLFDEGSLDASMLHRVIERRKGICVGLSTVYLVACEKAGLPVFGVHAPYHIFCRYDDGAEKINIECTAEGATHSDAEVAKNCGATDAALQGSVYFSSISRKALLADLLNNLCYDLAMRAKGTAPLTKAQLSELIDISVKLQPKYHEILDSAAVIYFINDEPGRALAACDQSIELLREFGAPPEAMPQYQQRRAKYEAAVAKLKQEKTPVAPH